MKSKTITKPKLSTYVLFEMGKWDGLCICATIAQGEWVGRRNLSGELWINGSQTQLPELDQ